jgi:hypothetical protein
MNGCGAHIQVFFIPSPVWVTVSTSSSSSVTVSVRNSVKDEAEKNVEGDGATSYDHHRVGLDLKED